MTSFWLYAVLIALATFGAVAVAASAIVGLVAPGVARRARRYAPESRARLLFWLRVLPVTCAAVSAFGIALPIYLWFEPRDNSDEAFARTLAVAAVAGGLLLARAAWRAAAAWRATSAVRREWQARGRRLEGFDAPMPVFAIDESFPTVAVVGVSSPSLFIAERVLAACSGDEVRAMVLHECAHVTHRDNLKRFLIQACPDTVGRGSALDRAWTKAAEEAADARATGGNPGSALELAQALIHVARLAAGATALEVASAFYLGDSIESRVRQLVEPSTGLLVPSRALAVVVCASIGALGSLVAIAAPAINQVMEAAVRVLP